MSEGEEIKKGTPPSRISEVPLTPEEKSAEVDKTLEAMKRSLERRLALKRSGKTPETAPVAGAELRERKQSEFMNVEHTVPAGEHLIVESVMTSTITVSPGAKLTISGEIMQSTVYIDKGGEYELLGPNMDSEFIHLDSIASQDTRAKSLRRASGTGRNKEPSSNSVKPDKKNEDATLKITKFLDTLVEGEEFLVVDKDGDQVSFIKKNNRIEDETGGGRFGDVIGLVRNHWELRRKPQVDTPDAPISKVDDASKPAVEIWTLDSLLLKVADGAEFTIRSKSGNKREKYRRVGSDIVTLKSKEVVTDKVLGRFNNNGWTFLDAVSASDNEKDEKEKRTERILHWLGEYSHRPEPEIKAMVAELQRMLSTNPDDATIDDITRRMTEFDFPAQENGKDVATPDTGIDEKQAQKIRKDQVRAVVDQLGDLGTVEATDLATEGLKLQFLFDLTDAQVAEFEEKARALLSAPATVDQPLGTVDPVIRNLDGKGKEQRELFELHEGDEFNRTVDGKTEWIQVFKLQGQFVSVQKRALLANGDRSESAYGMTVAELQAKLHDDKYERSLDLNLDNPASPDTPFDETLAFQPLNPGESAIYTGKLGGVTIERDSSTGLYWITGAGAGKADRASFTEQDVRSNAQHEQWQRVETTEVNPDLRGRDPRNYEELFEDDVWVVRDVNGDISKQLIIEHLYKNKGKVYASVEDVRGNDMTEREVEIEGLRRELEEQGYVLQKSGEKSERALDGSAPKPAIEAKDSDKMTEVERLKLLLEGDRLEFVTVDYKQNTAWSKVTGKIRALLGGERNDADTRIARERYENALIALQNAQIEDIKAQGLTGDKLRIRMGEMLMYYKYDERVKLFETRTRVAAEQKGWPQKAWDVYEKIGTKYNALPSKVRIGIAVGGLALAGGLAFAGAAGAAAGTLALRRALASFAAGASLNTLADKGVEGVRKYRVGKEHDREMTRLGALENQPPEVTLELFEKFLAKDRENLDKKFQSQKTEQILRRTFILGGSGLASTYFSFKGISDFLSGGARSAADQAQDLERVMRERGIKPPGTSASATETGRLTRSMAPATSASVVERASFASTPASASSAPTAALTPERPVSAPGATTPIASPRVAEFAPGKPVTPEITSIQKIHEVTSADGKRGLWGILDNRLPKGFEGDKNRAIQSLENAMRARLDAMSPADRASLGFPKGLPDGRVNLDFIKPGDKIDFGALLTPQEIQDALEGKSVGAPSVPNVGETLEATVKEASKVVTAASSDLSPAELDAAMKGAEDEMIAQDRARYGYTGEEQKALKLAEDQMIADELAKDKITTATLSGQSYDDVRNAYTAKEFDASQVVETKAVALSAFEQAPAEVKTEMMLRTTGNIRQALFLTPELMADTRMNAPFDYTINRGAMGFVQMGRITEKFAELHSGEFNRFNRFAFPLHPSQVDQVVRLVSLAQDPRFFGTAGLPKSVETVDQYTRRIAHLALSSGKEKELFMLLQGRRNSLI